MGRGGETKSEGRGLSVPLGGPAGLVGHVVFGNIQLYFWTFCILFPYCRTLSSSTATVAHTCDEISSSI